MKKRMFIGLVAIALLGMCLLLFSSMHSREPMPSYQGRTAQEWLEDVFKTNQSQALQAFREMGTDAFPVVVRALGKKDSAWDKLNRQIYWRLPRLVQKHFPKPVSDQEQQEIWSAAELVLTNVRDAKETLPDLIKILQDKRCGSRAYTLTLVANMVGPDDEDCVSALAGGLAEKDFGTRYQVLHGLMRIGPSAKAAVPALTNLLHETNLDIRVLAAVSLWKIDGQTNTALTALHECLGTTNYSYMKGWAPMYLREINPHDESLIPYFIRQLEGSHGGPQLSAAAIIGTYGSAAKDAVPALVKLLDSPDRDLRERAFRSLKRIDPETATKYEPK